MVNTRAATIADVDMVRGAVLAALLALLWTSGGGAELLPTAVNAADGSSRSMLRPAGAAQRWRALLQSPSGALMMPALLWWCMPPAIR